MILRNSAAMRKTHAHGSTFWGATMPQRTNTSNMQDVPRHKHVLCPSDDVLCCRVRMHCASVPPLLHWLAAVAQLPGGGEERVAPDQGETILPRARATGDLVVR